MRHVPRNERPVYVFPLLLRQNMRIAIDKCVEQSYPGRAFNKSCGG